MIVVEKRPTYFPIQISCILTNFLAFLCLPKMLLEMALTTQVPQICYSNNNDAYACSHIFLKKRQLYLRAEPPNTFFQDS